MNKFAAVISMAIATQAVSLNADKEFFGENARHYTETEQLTTLFETLFGDNADEILGGLTGTFVSNDDAIEAAFMEKLRAYRNAVELEFETEISAWEKFG